MAHDASGAASGAASAEVARRGFSVDAGRAQTQAAGMKASFEDVVRQTGWLLHLRAQLARQGQGAREPLPMLYPLARVCKSYLEHAVALRDHLAHLERALEKQDGKDELVAPDSSLAQLDPELYRVISAMPLDWSGENAESTDFGVLPNMTALPELASTTAAANAPPGADASSAIAIDSDDEEPTSARRSGDALANDQPTKRRKVEGSDAPDIMSMFFAENMAGDKKAEAAPEALASASTDASGLDQLIADNMSDLSWLDFSSLGNHAGEDSQFAGLMGDSAEFSGLSSLDFPTQDEKKPS